MADFDIAPGLLVAMPQLEDPNFARSVVLMIRHSEEGSFGIIANRPSEISLQQVLESLDLNWNGSPDAVVWSGGPVEPDTGFLLHAQTDGIAGPECLEIGEDLLLSTRTQELERLVAAPPDELRFLMGYSGWGPGQLESELAQGAWIHARPTLQLLFGTDPDRMWEEALRSLGIEPGSLIPGPGIH